MVAPELPQLVNFARSAVSLKVDTGLSPLTRPQQHITWYQSERQVASQEPGKSTAQQTHTAAET